LRAAGIKRDMQIAVVGPGGIGSTFAFQLARAGHGVTVVARGARLEQLRRDGAIITTDDERAPVRVSGELDADTDWDLVLVTVLVSEVDVLLAPLGRTAGKTVMFMFNTFDSLGRLRDAVGPQRFAFGFPALMASLEDGKLSATIPRRGITTTVSEPLWAKVFADAGIPATVHDDMESWLRSHAALIVPLAIAGGMARRRRRGISWVEAGRLARATDEAFRLVRGLGNVITPASVAMLARLPVPVLAALLWVLTRLPVFTSTIAAVPADEPRVLIDQMTAAAPGQTPELLAVRP
jgi:2-dehydropantoate 2-reductase